MFPSSAGIDPVKRFPTRELPQNLIVKWLDNLKTARNMKHTQEKKKTICKIEIFMFQSNSKSIDIVSHTNADRDKSVHRN